MRIEKSTGRKSRKARRKIEEETEVSLGQQKLVYESTGRLTRQVLTAVVFPQHV